jgi:hypothetical protein
MPANAQATLWPEAVTQYTVVGHQAVMADPSARPDLIFETADDYITVGTVSDSGWRGFCAAAESSELIETRSSIRPLPAPGVRPNGSCRWRKSSSSTRPQYGSPGSIGTMCPQRPSGLISKHLSPQN